MGKGDLRGGDTWVSFLPPVLGDALSSPYTPARPQSLQVASSSFPAQFGDLGMIRGELRPRRVTLGSIARALPEPCRDPAAFSWSSLIKHEHEKFISGDGNGARGAGDGGVGATRCPLRVSPRPLGTGEEEEEEEGGGVGCALRIPNGAFPFSLISPDFLGMSIPGFCAWGGGSAGFYSRVTRPLHAGYTAPAPNYPSRLLLPELQEQPQNFLCFQVGAGCPWMSPRRGGSSIEATAVVAAPRSRLPPSPKSAARLFLRLPG